GPLRSLSRRPTHRKRFSLTARRPWKTPPHLHPRFPPSASTTTTRRCIKQQTRHKCKESDRSFRQHLLISRYSCLISPASCLEDHTAARQSAFRFCELARVDFANGEAAIAQSLRGAREGGGAEHDVADGQHVRGEWFRWIDFDDVEAFDRIDARGIDDERVSAGVGHCR